MSFSKDDIYKAPDLTGGEPVSYTIHGAGRTWDCLVSTAAVADAEAWMKLAAVASPLMNGQKLDPIVVDPPKQIAGSLKPFTVKDSKYVAILGLIAECVIEPKMSVEEWAILGKKVGGAAMDALGMFVLISNGLLGAQVQSEATAQKKDLKTPRKSATKTASSGSQ